jgi:hypothetical protein
MPAGDHRYLVRRRRIDAGRWFDCGWSLYLLKRPEQATQHLSTGER